jgi:hypothetical protein
VNGTCCVTCGGSCCASNAVCIRDQAGNEKCALPCTKSSDCTGANGTCCWLQADGSGACVQNQAGLACRCSTNADCAGFAGETACAPFVMSDIIQFKQLICRPNDAAAWDGCNPGAGACCPTNYDCLGDAAGNRYCSRTCSNTAQCASSVAFCNMGATCHDCVPGCSSGGCMPTP